MLVGYVESFGMQVRNGGDCMYPGKLLELHAFLSAIESWPGVTMSSNKEGITASVSLSRSKLGRRKHQKQRIFLYVDPTKTGFTLYRHKDKEEKRWESLKMENLNDAIIFAKQAYDNIKKLYKL